MFTETRRKLTWLNTFLTVALLVAFVLLSYFLLHFFLTYTRQADIRGVIQQEIDERLRKHPNADSQKQKEARDEEDHLLQHGYFLYTFDLQGRVVERHDTNPKIAPSILEKLAMWQPENLQFQSLTLSADKHEYRYLVGGTSYQSENKRYVIMLGMDMSLEDSILERYAMILGFLTLIFSVGYFIAGWYLSNRAIAPIRQSYERQKAFTSDASHELRTPLSVLQSTLEVLETEPLTDFSRELVHDMRDEVRRMTMLVQNLLTLARMDQNIMPVPKEIVDMSEVSRKIERLFQPVAAQKELTLSVVCQEGVKGLWGDQDRVIQLIEILLDNAMKFTPPGGKVTVTIDSYALNDKEGTRIVVKDTGCGIPAAEINQIFERFYKIDRSRNRDHSGSGLGLSIAKMIVDAYEGKIWVESEEDIGSQFTVWFPQSSS